MFRPMFLIALLALSACAAPLSKHPLTPARLGAPITSAEMIVALKRSSDAQLKKVKVADWNFKRVYLDQHNVDQKGKPIKASEKFDPDVYFYVFRHPEKGLFLIDAGFPKNHKDDYGFILKRYVRDTGLVVHHTTAGWLTENTDEPIQAVFITHLHYDHIQGVRDLDPALPIYVGPNAGARRHFFHRIIARPTKRALKDKPPLRTWNFKTSANDEAPPIIDVFADGTLFAIHVPGHTPGSTAYLVNAADGAHLITGDAIHTVNGWTGPARSIGTFKPDLEQSWHSLDQLRTLVKDIEGVTIHPGHESF